MVFGLGSEYGSSMLGWSRHDDIVTAFVLIKFGFVTWSTVLKHT